MPTCSFANGQAQANGGVPKGHDSSQDGHEPQPVKVRNLAQHNLEGSKDQHERIVGNLQSAAHWPNSNTTFQMAAWEQRMALH